MNRPSPRLLSATRECRSGLMPPRQAAANPCSASSVRLHGARLGSQCGGQRTQPLSFVRRRPASAVRGECHARRHRAASGNGRELIWELEAAGSNPAIPTPFFECVVSLWKQAPAHRQLSPGAGRGGWVAVHVGCPLAPLLQRDRAPPIWSNFSSPDRSRSAAIWVRMYGKCASCLFQSARRARSSECRLTPAARAAHFCAPIAPIANCGYVTSLGLRFVKAS
jgi:hypothetical protein